MMTVFGCSEFMHLERRFTMTKGAKKSWRRWISQEMRKRMNITIILLTYSQYFCSIIGLRSVTTGTSVTSCYSSGTIPAHSFSPFAGREADYEGNPLRLTVGNSSKFLF